MKTWKHELSYVTATCPLLKKEAVGAAHKYWSLGWIQEVFWGPCLSMEIFCWCCLNSYTPHGCRTGPAAPLSRTGKKWVMTGKGELYCHSHDRCTFDFQLLWHPPSLLFCFPSPCVSLVIGLQIERAEQKKQRDWMGTVDILLQLKWTAAVCGNSTHEAQILMSI